MVKIDDDTYSCHCSNTIFEVKTLVKLKRNPSRPSRNIDLPYSQLVEILYFCTKCGKQPKEKVGY